MKVVLAGGHLAPALAVLEKLEKKDVYYVGRKHFFEGDVSLSLEYQEITKLGVPFFAIKTGRLQRRFTKYTLTSFLKLPVGFYQAFKILNKIKPDVVVSFGGYVSVPLGFAAFFLKIPLVIHEQTLGIGFANKILSKFASKICISWELSQKYFPKEKTILTGNPIKQEVLEIKSINKIKNNPQLIYITGGSSGSHVINELVQNCIKELLKKYSVIHQTGDSREYKDFEKLIEIKNNLPKNIFHNYTVKKFLTSKESARAMSNADLIVGRSGINTVTELIYLQKPAFFIPLPFSQKQEQTNNANFMKNLGLAEVVNQDILTPSLFLSTLKSMLGNIENYKLNKKILFKNSAQNIVNILINVSQKKTT